MMSERGDMTPEEREFATMRKWWASPIGKELRRFISAHGQAWITDQREYSSQAAMKRDWERSEAAEKVVIARLRAMQHALEMVRDADEDCKRDGLPTIPPAARAVIDRALAETMEVTP